VEDDVSTEPADAAPAPSALAVPTTDALPALARLAEDPTHPARRALRFVVWGKIREWDDPDTRPDGGYRAEGRGGHQPRHADPTLAPRAEALGLRWAGVLSEQSLLGVFTKDVWLDRDRVIVLHGRRRLLRDHAPRSVYHLATYFDDGSCVLTWSHVPQTQSWHMLDSRAGDGDIDVDLAAHREAIARWSDARSCRALAVGGPEALPALIRHYYRYVVPLPMAFMALTNATMLTLGVLGLLVFVIGTLVGMLR
jgi:hypothetical protein